MGVRIMDRFVPAWLAVFAVVAVGTGSYFGGLHGAEQKPAAPKHCPVVSRQEVEKAFGLHKHVIEQVNGETCSFVSEYGYPIFGVSRMNDVRGELYASVHDGSTDAANVPTAEASTWIPGYGGLYFKKSFKLVVINCGSTIDKHGLMELATIIAQRT